MRKVNVGILGATGAVGREMLKVMEEKNLPIGQLRLFASSRSAGKVMKFHNRQIIIEVADEHSFDGLDVVLGAVDAEQSRMYAPLIQKAKAIYIGYTSDQSGCIKTSSGYYCQSKLCNHYWLNGLCTASSGKSNKAHCCLFLSGCIRCRYCWYG